MNKFLMAVAFFMTVTPAAFAETQADYIRCSVDTKQGAHLAGETSSLARGVDLTGEKGYDFYAYIDGRTDRRVFRVEAYETATGNLLAAKIALYGQLSASLTLQLEDAGLIFSCEMKR